MKTINSRILNSYAEANSDDDFVHQLDGIANTEGEAAYQSFFSLLTDHRVEPSQAKEKWLAVVDHRRQLSQSLGRPVNLLSAICDSFSSEEDSLNNLKLTKISTHNRIIKEATHDSLTGLLNKNYFYDSLAQQLALAARNQNELSLLFIDIDDFKSINDSHSHVTGDSVLKETAELIQKAVRECDVAVRFGGEEFVIIMPNTNCIDALILANRLRLAVQKYRYKEESSESLLITISCGIAAFPVHAKNAEDLIRYADHAMYQAKGAGKNNVCLFKDENRRYLRIPISKHVQIKELGFSVSPEYTGICKDIGIGGILFQNEELIPIGANMQINIELSKEKPLLLIGTVVRVESAVNGMYDIGVALSLKEMDNLVKSKISQLLTSVRDGSIIS